MQEVCCFVAFKNVNFTENEAGIAGGAIRVLFSSNVAIAFENVIFTENTAKYQGTAIGLEQSVVSEGIGHLVFHKCEFIGNYGYYGAVRLQGRYNISCESSTFLSNFALYVCGGLSLELENSMVRISNSLFSNNSCWYSSGGAVGIFAKNNTNAVITDYTFINNNAYNGTGGAISFLGSADEVNMTNCHDPLVPRSWNYKNSVEIQRVRFQGNIARNGNALYITNGLVTLRDCLINDNFGFASSSQLITYGSANLRIYNSVFKGVAGKLLRYGTKYVFSSFLGIYSDGPLVVHNSTVDQTVPLNEPLIIVSKTGQQEFDISSRITCPFGFYLKKSDYSYQRNGLSGCTMSVTDIRIFCKECNSKYYSLQFGQSKGLNTIKGFVCRPCPYGANCLPSIKSKNNFWGYKSGFNPPTLTFIRCPVDYCKSPKPGSDSYNACQGKRTGVMCGTCSRGYTETLLSTHCTVTKDCKQYWFWIAFLVFISLTALLLIFKPPVITFLVKQVLWMRKLFCNCAANSLFTIQPLTSGEARHENKQYSYFVEIVFYFYQISQLFLSSLSSDRQKTNVLPSLLDFFNFQFSISEKACPFVGLMPHTKSFLKLSLFLP